MKQNFIFLVTAVAVAMAAVMIDSALWKAQLTKRLTGRATAGNNKKF